jgi:aarF domain-containing kinase
MPDGSAPHNRLVRFYHTGTTLGRVFAGYKWITLREKLRGKDWAEAKRVRHHRWSAERIYRTAVKLEGLLIKTGQFLGSRADVLPEEYVDVLSALHDQVPPEPFEVTRRTVESELGKSLEDVFSSFEETPIASASLAQVHKAVLKDGRVAAVKVQYPDIERIVHIDLANMAFFVGVLNRIDGSLDYTFVVNEMRENIPKELDFINEGRNAERVARDFADDPDVHVPEIYWEHTTKRVLTMEFMEGIKISEVSELEAAGIDKREVARMLMDAYARQMIRNSFFHADPHPGNLLVQPGPQLVFLDFGQSKELTPEFSRLFATLAKAMFESDHSTMGGAMRDIGLRTKKDDAEGYVELSNAYAGDLIRGASETGYIDMESATESYVRVLKLVKDNPVTAFPPEMLMIGRVFGLLSGISKHLDAQTNMPEVFRPYYPDADGAPADAAPV